MIEQVIDEILAAENEARETVKQAGERAAEINLDAARIPDKIKKDYGDKFRTEAEIARAAAEKKGDEEADKVIGDARKNAEKLKETASERFDAAAEYILGALFNGN